MREGGSAGQRWNAGKGVGMQLLTAQGRRGVRVMARHVLYYIVYVQAVQEILRGC